MIDRDTDAIGKKFQNHDTLLHEYDCLRAEILQIYSEQTQLVFISSLAVVGAFFTWLSGNFPVTHPLLVVHLLLLLFCVIGWRSVSNYTRIFRIGLYIATIHEKECHFEPGWHSIWREVHKKRCLVGQEAPMTEALFLLVLGVVAVIVPLYSSGCAQLETHCWWCITTVVLVCIYLWSLVLLFFTVPRSNRYKPDLEHAYRIISDHRTAGAKRDRSTNKSENVD